MARALYIHWPFCLKKCPYCDFNSHVRRTVDHDQWKNALITDMRNEAGVSADQPLSSIFFGGGTPSLMPPSLVAALLEEAEELWNFDHDIEITLEGNPSSVEAARFAELSLAGINRVSLGLQSLHDEHLHFLGRLHSAREGLEALATAQKHFDRVSFDLIYALPGQTADQWRAELERAVTFGTDHLSLYQLTIEPNTRFATDVRIGAFEPLADNPAADLFDITRELTQGAGMPAYEVSNHARPGQESQHNLTYWRYRDYCGIGPGAHGRRNGHATLRHKKPENYLSAVDTLGHGLREERPLSPPERASEALLMGLRLAEGIHIDDLADRFGLSKNNLLEPAKLSTFEALGFVWQQDGRVGVTPKGMPVLDAVLGELVCADLVTA